MSESMYQSIELGASTDARTSSSVVAAQSGASGGRGHKRRWPGLTRWLAVVAALLMVGLVVVQPAGVAAAGTRSGVLAPSATPYGYSRADMTRLLAPFTASGNDPKLYPDTPFQVLYAAPDQSDVRTVTRRGVPCMPPARGCGVFATQKGTYANMFHHVDRRTTFFVPIDNADDSPTVVGDYPTTLRGAKAYLFSPNQLGGKGFVISIDSKPVPIGPEYVAGPVETAPLPDGGGTHMITLGAFLSPMSKGTHVVEIRGGYFGEALFPAVGIAFLAFDLTYRVTVD